MSVIDYFYECGICHITHPAQISNDEFDMQQYAAPLPDTIIMVQDKKPGNYIFICKTHNETKS